MNNKNVSANFLFRNIFFSKSDFCMITPHFLKPTSKMFCNFSLELNMSKRRHFFFSALGPETEEQIKLAKNKIRFDL